MLLPSAGASRTPVPSRIQGADPVRRILSGRWAVRVARWPIAGVLCLACALGEASPSTLRLQSSCEGSISKVVLIYSQTAEVGVVSLVDILAALDADAIVLNQFEPSGAAFHAFSSALAHHTSHVRPATPRLQFIQDGRPYGPWPRDQAVIDDEGLMWVSAGDHHQLRPVFESLDETYGIRRRDLPFELAGANLLACGETVLAPDRLDIAALRSLLADTVVAVPSPDPPEPFHLDLVVMPLADRLVVVGDDGMARSVLEALSPEERAAVVARWAAEYAVSAGNVDYAVRGGRLSFRTNDRPPLILWRCVKEKLAMLTALARPDVFAAAVAKQAPYVWDDRIAEALQTRGFTVVRVPFWPGAMGASETDGPLLPTIAYPNSLVWDDGIIMPVYGIAEMDSIATRIYRQVSRRPVHHMRGGAILGFGSSGPHCLTLEFRE